LGAGNVSAGFANGAEGRIATTTDWNAIDWRKVERSVSNLRRRIFRASREGDHRKVRSLQKLVLRSYANALQSVRRVTQINAGRNTPGVDMLVVKTPKARGELVDYIRSYQPWKASRLEGFTYRNGVARRGRWASPRAQTGRCRRS
jgi:RNA-directed DNA polymerase